MFGFFNKPIEEPTADSLLGYAERYFYKYQGQLSSGTLKGKLGHLHITVAFAVEEEERK